MKKTIIAIGSTISLSAFAAPISPIKNFDPNSSVAPSANIKALNEIKKDSQGGIQNLEELSLTDQLMMELFSLGIISQDQTLSVGTRCIGT